jgi:hypothetical protein
MHRRLELCLKKTSINDALTLKTDDNRKRRTDAAPLGLRQAYRECFHRSFYDPTGLEIQSRYRRRMAAVLIAPWREEDKSFKCRASKFSIPAPR